MEMNTHIHEKLLEERRRDIQREMEQRRMVAQAGQQRLGVGRHIVGQLGKSLVAVGTWMEQFESQETLASAEQ